MRVFMVRPGPLYSVQDVHNGWVRAFRRAGCEVADFEFDKMMELYQRSVIGDGDGGFAPAFDIGGAMHMASKHVEAAIYEFWPDVVILTSGFWVHPYILRVMQARPHHTVYLFTESPYEDQQQLELAQHVGTVILNDPLNVESFRQVNPRSFYFHHAYDPELHCPGPSTPELECDVSFVGTGFTSRQQLLEQVDWSGLDLKLGGNWTLAPDDWPLNDRVVHPREECMHNVDAVDLYRSTKVGLNIYRREIGPGGNADGIAVGPREVELAACGTFFLRDQRVEGDLLFDMLPVFLDAEELGEMAHWWVANDDARAKTAAMAREAIAEWTFDASVARLLRLVERAPKIL